MRKHFSARLFRIGTSSLNCWRKSRPAFIPAHGMRHIVFTRQVSVSYTRTFGWMRIPAQDSAAARLGRSKGIQNMKRKNVEPEDQGGSLFPRRALHSDAVAASAIRILMGFHPAGSFLNWNPMSSSWYKRALRDMISVKDRCDVAHCHPRSPMLKEPPTE